LNGKVYGVAVEPSLEPGVRKCLETDDEEEKCHRKDELSSLKPEFRFVVIVYGAEAEVKGIVQDQCDADDARIHEGDNGAPEPFRGLVIRRSMHVGTEQSDVNYLNDECAKPAEGGP
jgi:hypothetical protein